MTAKITFAVILLSLFASAQLTAAGVDDIEPATIKGFSLTVTVIAFALVMVAIGTVLRKRFRRRRLNGLSHLF